MVEGLNSTPAVAVTAQASTPWKGDPRMLVLSRRLHERIVFPALDTTVEIVSVKPGVVRLGIEAPPEVTVLREEVVCQTGRRAVGTPPALRLDHRLRNRLNVAAAGLGLLRRQLEAGLAQPAVDTLDRIDREFQTLRRQVESNSPKALPRPPTRPRRRALLVEDDRNECELLAGFLRLAGMEVATAGDGAAALDYLQAHGAPDVVLLDMVLPHCDGPATVQAIRRDPAWAGTKIFAVSGQAPDRFDLCGDRGGLDGWFRKPINPELLLRDLQDALERGG
jgi:carbon storage regulator CsrA